MTFLCTHCGKGTTHCELSYQRPDDVWSLSPSEKAQRVSGGNDLCVLTGVTSDEAPRHFIRGVIPLPMVGVDDGVGVWVEVSARDFVRYKHLYDKDASQEPGFSGVVANAPNSFEDTLGADVMVQLGTGSEAHILVLHRGGELFVRTPEHRHHTCAHS